MGKPLEFAIMIISFLFAWYLTSWIILLYLMSLINNSLIIFIRWFGDENFEINHDYEW